MTAIRRGQRDKREPWQRKPNVGQNEPAHFSQAFKWKVTDPCSGSKLSFEHSDSAAAEMFPRVRLLQLSIVR